MSEDRLVTEYPPKPGTVIGFVDLQAAFAPQALWSGTPWPFADGSVQHLRAYQLIHRIPNEWISVGQDTAAHMRTKGAAPDTRNGVGDDARRSAGTRSFRTRSFTLSQPAFYWFFDQAWRVAAPDAVLELAWPLFESNVVALPYLQRLSIAGRRGPELHIRADCDWRIESSSIVGSPGSARECRAVLRKPVDLPQTVREPETQRSPSVAKAGPQAPEGYDDVGESA